MNRVVLLALTFAPSVAAADDPPSDPLDVHARGDEPDGYVASGAVWGESQGFAANGVTLEIGKRIYGSSWFARGIGEACEVNRSDEAGRGSFVGLAAGMERRGCIGGGMLCVSAGLDLGIHGGEFQHKIYTPDGKTHESSERLDALVAVPRLTVDAGGRIRFRGVLELPVSMRTADSPPMIAARGDASPTVENGNQFASGFALSLAIAVGF
jgi:hypothetical protein